MTIPNDTIERALRMLGYHNPTIGPDDKWIQFDNNDHCDDDTAIPTDLASLLKRCRERMGMTRCEFVYYPETVVVIMVTEYKPTPRASLTYEYEEAIATDELDALLLALAAAWDAKESKS